MPSASKGKLSMRPRTGPSEIFASSTRGGGSAARVAVVGSVPTMAANIVAPFIAASWRYKSSAKLSRSRGRLPDIGLVEGGPQARGELEGIVIGPEMHEEEARLLGGHGTGQGGDLDAGGVQGLDHGIDLAGEQDEVAGDGRRVEARGLEVDGNRRTHGARQGHSLIGHRLGARNAELVDAAAILS